MNRQMVIERLRRGADLQNRGELDAAEVLYREVLAFVPQEPDALHLLALLALQRDKAADAVHWAELACAAAPRIANFRNTAGEARRRAGDRDGAGREFQRAIELAPDFAMAFHNLALVRSESGDSAAAWGPVARALALRPDYPEALLLALQLAIRLGKGADARILSARLVPMADGWPAARIELARYMTIEAGHALDRGDPQEAERLTREALAACPDAAPAWNNLGSALREQERVGEAEQAFTVAVACAAQVDHMVNLAALLREGDRLEEAEAYLRAALKRAPEHIGARFMLARVALQRGQYGAGWKHFDARWPYRGETRPYPDLPLWTGEPLHGKRILLFSEQGYGDIVQMLRFVPVVAARGGLVVVLVPAPIETLVRRQLAGTGIEVTAELVPQDFDFVCPLFDLPQGLTIDQPEKLDGSPYLLPDAGMVDAFRKHLADLPGLKVGLAWRGADHFGNRRRAVPDAAWLPVLACPSVSFVSLQHDVRPAMIAGRPLIDPVEPLHDFDDLAALMGALDLVISIDSAPAHLAGALGVPVWTLVPRVRDWRWGNASESMSPWYASMRLFRQSQAGNWEAPMQELAFALCALAQGRVESPALPVPSAVEAGARLEHSFPLLAADCRHGRLVFPLLDRFIGRSLLVYGEYSNAEVTSCLEWIRPGDTVLDVGANVGALTVPIARQVGTAGRVLAFEPQPAIFACLRENIEQNGLHWADARRLAVGDRDSTATVPVFDPGQPRNFGGVALAPITPDVAGEMVSVITIDGLELAACRLIKVDVEGAEPAVLAGARRTLARCRPVLYVECDRPENWPMLHRLLGDAGYRIYRDEPPLFSADNYHGCGINFFPNMVSGNLLCLPSEWPGISGRQELVDGSR